MKTEFETVDTIRRTVRGAQAPPSIPPDIQMPPPKIYVIDTPTAIFHCEGNFSKFDGETASVRKQSTKYGVAMDGFSPQFACGEIEIAVVATDYLAHPDVSLMEAFADAAVIEGTINHEGMEESDIGNTLRIKVDHSKISHDTRTVAERLNGRAMSAPDVSTVLLDKNPKPKSEPASRTRPRLTLV